MFRNLPRLCNSTAGGGASRAEGSLCPPHPSGHLRGYPAGHTARTCLQTAGGKLLRRRIAWTGHMSGGLDGGGRGKRCL